MAEELMRVRDFEWAGICQYIVYLAGAAGLKEISMDAINNFPYVTVGGVGLKRRKEKALGVLEFNRARLEAFVENNKDGIDDLELSVIRSMYRQFSDGEQIVRYHLSKIESLMITECDVRRFDFEGEGEDEFPF